MAEFVIRSHRRPWGKRYTFVLVADNGERVPDVYTTKQAAARGIEAMRRLASTAVTRNPSES